MAIEKITQNPFKTGSKAHTFFEACELNPEDGYSRIVELEELTELGLKTDNGGSWCRSDGPLGRYFLVRREKKYGRINSVQLVGYKQNDFSGKIDTEIVKAYKDEPCRILQVSSRYVEVDHKDGRKQDYRLHDNQTLDDFQPLHKSCNVAKRNHCSVCAKTGIRFDARLIGYSVAQYIGPIEYHGSCVGCYWHDPKKFNQETTECYDKTK